MARAKRTDRAEARRRHRAATTGADSGVDTEASAPTSGAVPSKSSSGGSSAAMSTPGGRLGVMAALRAAFHPVDVRADFAALPWLAVHTKALWVPILITLVGTIVIAVAVSMGIQSPIVAGVSTFTFQYFIQPPAIGGVFIAGFLAPRASWLLGAIVGLFAAACYAFLILAFPSSGTTPVDPANVRDLALSGFLLSPAFGILFASGAAWYRRFLQLSNPNRGRRAEAKKKPNDGKSRTTGRDQKAGARR